MVGGVGEKSRRLFVVAGREVTARRLDEGLDVRVIDRVSVGHVASYRGVSWFVGSSAMAAARSAGRRSFYVIDGQGLWE